MIIILHGKSVSDYVTFIGVIEVFSVSVEPLVCAVPALRGIVLLVLGLSMLGSGAVRLSRRLVRV